MRTIGIAALLLLLALLHGCAATSEPGWEGHGATEFGTADTICAAEADDHANVERGMAYQACMRRHGWTPGHRD